MDNTAIVFSCKVCGEVIFAALNKPELLRDEDTAQEIKDHLMQGNKLSVISTAGCGAKLGNCTC